MIQFFGPVILCMPGFSSVFDAYDGPSGVRALPLAAGTNEGGHYFGPSGAVQTVSDSRRPLF